MDPDIAQRTTDKIESQRNLLKADKIAECAWLRQAREFLIFLQRMKSENRIYVVCVCDSWAETFSRYPVHFEGYPPSYSFHMAYTRIADRSNTIIEADTFDVCCKPRAKSALPQ